MRLEDPTDKTRPTSQPIAVDLFCGAGGLSYGMKHAGITISAGIDIDPACKHPFEANVEADFYEKDVAELSPQFVESLFPENSVRVLAGCAPCQPFSSYSNRSLERDAQWQLLPKFGEMVTALQPEIVTMENVPRLREYAVFDEFQAALRNAGYFYDYSVVRCAEYGVPQSRRRLVLLASRLGPIQMVPPTHTESDFATVKNSIQHMPPIEAGQASPSDPLHRSSALSAQNLARIQHSKPGGTWRDWGQELRADCHVKQSGKTYPSVYGRMEWDRLGPTITTQFHGYGNGRFGHPVQDRAISLREGALMQTFPKEYSFIPAGESVQISSVARLIGNAVPVKLGEAIGKSIVAHLERFHD
jgi:DNA (cytosine-5)-methyltransferase 1